MTEEIEREGRGDEGDRLKWKKGEGTGRGRSRSRRAHVGVVGAWTALSTGSTTLSVTLIIRRGTAWRLSQNNQKTIQKWKKGEEVGR